VDNFVLGPYVVKPSLGHVERDGSVVRVRPRVMDLLVFFAEHPGIVLPPQRLLDNVWGTRFVTYSALTRTIAELRRAMGDETERPWLLETIPKRGYRLLVNPASIVGTAPGAPPKDAGGDDPSSPRFWVSAGDRSVALPVGTHLLGRDESAALRLDSPWVSRRHAAINVGAGEASIVDLGSRNGTFVNGRRLQGESPLCHGDEVRLGRSRLVVFWSNPETGTVADEIL
jgi:DNA-binding winged helix-turn-helix (wHTH) protein